MTATLENEQQRDSVRQIHYASNPSIALDVHPIAAWDRDTITPVSGSSGLKDYFKNQVWSLFQDQPKIDRIVMLRANGPTFLLLRCGGQWFDITGERVIGGSL